MGQYYYLDGQTPVGPFGLRDVYTLLDREVVNPATLMCRESGAGWEPLGSFHELTGKVRSRGTLRDSGGVGGASPTEPLAADGSVRRRRRGSSGASVAASEPPPNRLVNLTAVIIAVLLSLVAVYVTYTIGHANQEISIDPAADATPAK